MSLLFPDFVGPGDTVFDVGAFIGSLTSVLSRLVGPTGRVISFEANAATVPILTANLITCAHFNVFPVHRAVHHTSGETLSFASPEGNPAATHIGEGELSATTIALDDFVDQTGLVPNFLKMDVEGAEFSALQGFSRTIQTHLPNIIFEHNVGDDRALNFLIEQGYQTFCCSQYQMVRRSSDCLEGATVRNIAAVHVDKLANTPFAFLGDRTELAAPKPVPYRSVEGVGHVYDIVCEPGRYILEIDVDSQMWNGRVVFCEIVVDDVVRQKYYVDAETFVANCRDIPFSVSKNGQRVQYRLAGVGGQALPPPKSIRVNQLVGMPPVRTALF